jgi:hypothetical protein
MLSKLQGLVQLEGLGKLKKYIHYIWSQIRGLPACSIVPQPIHYRVCQILILKPLNHLN